MEYELKQLVDGYFEEDFLDLVEGVIRKIESGKLGERWRSAYDEYCEKHSIGSDNFNDIDFADYLIEQIGGKGIWEWVVDYSEHEEEIVC